MQVGAGWSAGGPGQGRGRGNLMGAAVAVRSMCYSSLGLSCILLVA